MPSETAPELGTTARPERVLTIPNALSVLRLAGVPLFLWLLLGPGQDPAAHAVTDVWAIVVLAVGGITDWLDGKLARLLGQFSRLGALLDPAVDRLYILAALVGLGVREVVPWWAVVVLVARDLVLGVCLWVLRRRGYGPFVVTYLGKAATFLLLYAFPLLLAGLQEGWFADLARPFGYAFAVWGTAFYLYTGVLYLVQFVLALRHPVVPDGPAAPPEEAAAGTP
ncbi:CDP-alcohol phosphatidyltransferase family protein [Pseudonocardia sp. CA-107938]|uniref:CDP-alcohol phosphatidyltransferase family protein n=1 Tax=Pseudonocardia sp. CA-107938 TaxID=3240021 RepID=UPI003D8D8D5A